MKITILENQSMGVEKVQVPSGGVGVNGGPTLEDMWTLVFIDRNTGEQIRIGFKKDARDDLVRQLTGGIVLAGGDLPQL